MISILQNEVERLRPASDELASAVEQFLAAGGKIEEGPASGYICLLYTSDAADE